MRLRFILIAVSCLACVPAPARRPLESDVVERLPDGGFPSCEGFADSVSMAAFEAEYRLVVSQSVPDAQGLVGANKGYGRMVSARFQMGAGLLSRFAVERSEPGLAEAGLRGIEAGLASVDAAGVVVSEVPPDAPAGSALQPQDVASAAAFFLGDACQGLMALQRAPASWALQARLDTARNVVGRALTWLDTQEEVLRAGDAAAPNRLLFDARAYSRCGAFVGSSRLDIARRFIELALGLQRPDGVFVEGGGSDTSYQGVAIAIGADLLAGEPAHCEQLRFPVLRGALWLGAAVDSMGRLDSTGNTRTCGGGETFLGRAKDVDLSHAVRGFAAAATGSGDEALFEVARRFSGWATRTRDSCYP